MMPMVTSISLPRETLSPCLNIGIAMGYAHPDYRLEGTILEIIIRDKQVKAKVVKPPFVPKDWAQTN
jgi:glycine cleavage system aminomethyltransferase T